MKKFLAGLCCAFLVTLILGGMIALATQNTGLSEFEEKQLEAWRERDEEWHRSPEFTQMMLDRQAERASDDQ